MSGAHKLFLHDYAGHAFSVELAREFARRGYEVAYLYFAATTHTPKGEVNPRPDDPPNLRILGIQGEGALAKDKLLHRRSQDLRFARHLVEFLGTFNPEIVLSTCAPPEVQAMVMRHARRTRAHFINWVQDFWSEGARIGLRHRWPILAPLAGYVLGRSERHVILQSDANILICPEFLETARHWGADRAKCHLIPNWGVVERMPLRPKDNAWSREHGLSDKRCVLYAGSLGLKHDPDLLTGLAAAARSWSDVRIVVISEGSAVRGLAERKQSEGLENLILLPYQPFERLPEVLASGDILVALLEPGASTYCVPSKVLAYLCAGRAMLLSMPEDNFAAQIATEAGAARFCRSGDVADFVEAARNLIDDPGAMRRLGEAGRRYAERRFSIVRVTDEFEALFASLGRARSA